MASLLSYPGSSGYGVRPDGSYGPMYTAPPTASDTTAAVGDYPVMDVATGKLKSVKTGKPWTGALPQGWSNPYTQAGGSTQGVKVPYSDKTINPNDPNQRYQAVNITKSPDIASAQSDLMKEFNQNASNTLKGFTDYLSSFQSDIANARKATAAATDISPTVSALTKATGQYGSDLSASNAAYQKALADAAANTRGVVTQANATLPMYDTALNNIEGAQLAALQHNVGRYKLGTGTPTSLGTDEMRILSRGAAEAALPIELQKVQQRYNILGQMALPVEQQIGGQNISYAGSFLPSVAGARYGAETALPTTIQNLKNQVANMSTSQAIQFLTAQGIPANVIQQVLSGQIGNVAGLSNLEDMANYRGLQDVLGTYLSQPLGYNLGTGPLPVYNPSRYASTLPTTGNTLTATGAPTTVSPAYPTGGYTYQPIMGATGGAPFVPQTPQAQAPNYTQYWQDQMLAGALGA